MAEFFSSPILDAKIFTNDIWNHYVIDELDGDIKSGSGKNKKAQPPSRCNFFGINFGLINLIEKRCRNWTIFNFGKLLKKIIFKSIWKFQNL